MAPLTAAQLELLQRAHDGVPMWGGSVATVRLRREVDLLFALRLIEAGSAYGYQVTMAGSRALEVLTAGRSGVLPEP